MKLFNTYNKVVQSEGDTMTIQLVILEMTKDRSTVKWLVLGVQGTVSFADDREVVTKDHQTRPNLGPGKGDPLVGQQQGRLTKSRLWQ